MEKENKSFWLRQSGFLMSEKDGSLKSQQRININFRRFAYKLWREWEKYIFGAVKCYYS